MNQLKNDIDECQLKLERAKKLMDLLQDENTRWGGEIENLKNFD